MKTEEKVRDDAALMDAMKTALKLDGFWQEGYDLTERDQVVEIMTILLDMEEYDRLKGDLYRDLVDAGWGAQRMKLVFGIPTPMVDDEGEPVMDLSELRKIEMSAYWKSKYGNTAWMKSQAGNINTVKTYLR